MDQLDKLVSDLHRRDVKAFLHKESLQEGQHGFEFLYRHSLDSYHRNRALTQKR